MAYAGVGLAISSAMTSFYDQGIYFKCSATPRGARQQSNKLYGATNELARAIVGVEGLTLTPATLFRSIS